MGKLENDLKDTFMKYRKESEREECKKPDERLLIALLKICDLDRREARQKAS